MMKEKEPEGKLKATIKIDTTVIKLSLIKSKSSQIGLEIL
jgi:hypothetical protein